MIGNLVHVEVTTVLHYGVLIVYIDRIQIPPEQMMI